MKNKIIDKIKKLLALATSPNENEAKAAAAKAQSLLTHHNLDLQQVKDYVPEYELEQVTLLSKLTLEHKISASILREFFFVEVYSERQRRDGKAATSVKMFGTPENVEVGQYIYDFLVHKLAQLWKEYGKQNYVRGSSRNSFMMGFYYGLKEQLNQARQAAQTERGLVLVRDSRMQLELRNKVGHISRRTEKRGVADEQALEAGREQGKTVRIAKAISSSDGNKGRLLK